MNSWKTVRQDTAIAVEEFPESEFGFKPVVDVMTFRELAVHILQAGYGLTGLLLDGEENFATPEFRLMLRKHTEQLPAHASAAELAAALRTALDVRCGELSARPPEFYAGMITRMDGQRVTRLEMLQMIKEHELTHRSQMFMYLRLKGLVPATTRRRLSKASA